MLKEFDDAMTVRDLARALNIGVNAAYKLINSGEIGCKRVGRTIRVPKVCVIDFLKSARYNDSTVMVGDSALSEGEKYDRQPTD
jgi:DNA binding domain, excisionase family